MKYYKLDVNANPIEIRCVRCLVIELDKQEPDLDNTLGEVLFDGESLCLEHFKQRISLR